MKRELLFAGLWLFAAVLLLSDLTQGPRDFSYPEPPSTPDFSGYVEPTEIIQCHYFDPLSEIVVQHPHRKVPFSMVVHVCGIEGNDWVVVTSVAEGFGWGRVTKRGNGDYRVPMGASAEDPPSGVWIVTAFAEGYTVEPEVYMVFLVDGMIINPTQQFNFVFEKII